MEEQNLRTKAPILLAYLRDKGYSQYYIGLFRSAINYALRLRSERPDISYVEIYQTRVEADPDHRPLHHWRRLYATIEYFDRTGVLPGNGQTPQEGKKKYDTLSKEFRRAIDIYRREESKSGKKLTSINREADGATNFFCLLQAQGVFSFNDATEKHVQSVLDGYSCGYRKVIRVVVRRCAPYFEKDVCERFISLLPMTRNKRRNIEYLTAQEIACVKRALTAQDSCLCLRDKAIGLLALFTGLRGCDIIGLKLKDVDWENDLIIINQEKTGIPVKLPLRPIVGNAIYDYICHERPESSAEEIFLSRYPLHMPLLKGSAYNIAERIMKAAGIRQSKGSRRGLHIFRHHVATSLLNQDVPQPVISSVMGHSSPSSLNPYLSADFTHLKECALSIEQFPVGKGVFHD